MPALAGWVLDHKRLVVSFWAAVTIAAFAAIGPAGKSLSQQFGVPGREGFETNRHVAAIYGNGGDGSPLGPVVRPPGGATVPSRGVETQPPGALPPAKTAPPPARHAPPPPPPR